MPTHVNKVLYVHDPSSTDYKTVYVKFHKSLIQILHRKGSSNIITPTRLTERHTCRQKLILAKSLCLRKTERQSIITWKLARLLKMFLTAQYTPF